MREITTLCCKVYDGMCMRGPLHPLCTKRRARVAALRPPLTVAWPARYESGPVARAFPPTCYHTMTPCCHPANVLLLPGTAPQPLAQRLILPAAVKAGAVVPEKLNSRVAKLAEAQWKVSPLPFGAANLPACHGYQKRSPVDIVHSLYSQALLDGRAGTQLLPWTCRSRLSAPCSLSCPADCVPAMPLATHPPQLFCYGTFVVAGLYTTGSEPWFRDTRLYWVGWPHQPMT